MYDACVVEVEVRNILRGIVKYLDDRKRLSKFDFS